MPINTITQGKKFRNKIIRQLEKDHQCNIFYSILNNGTGLDTIVKNNILQYIKTFKEIIPGSATCLEIEIKEYKYNIVNIYWPANNNVQKVSFYETLFETANLCQ